MRALLALMQKKFDAANDYSSLAIKKLQELGMVTPALRAEEILFNHYQILMGAGRDIEAQPYLKQAYDVIHQKAATINNEDQKKSFFERISLNRAILTAIDKNSNA